MADWTTLTPSGDSRLIYVSDSLGDDGNDGLSEGAPKRTVGAGRALLRPGFPDWLQLKAGDTFRDQEIGNLQISGRSETERMVITRYGTGDNPILEISNTSGIRSTGGLDVSHWAFQHIDFYHYQRDRSNPSYNPSSAEYDGIDFLNRGANILVEGCRFRFCRTGIVFNSAADGGRQNVKINRCVVYYSHSAVGDNSQGIFARAIDGLDMDENVIIHNGWGISRDDPLEGASIFDHNVYIQRDCQNVRFVGNISAEASSHGIQERPGGICTDNLFVRNPIGILCGGDTPTPDNQEIKRNTILEGKDIDSSSFRGQGIETTNAPVLEMEDNIIANVTSIITNTRGAFLNGTPTYPNSAITMRDNIYYNWDRGGPRIDDPTNNVVNVNDNNGLFDFPVTGTNYDSELVAWNDPTRSVASYNASLGGTNSYEAWEAEVLQQSVTNWRTEYAVPAHRAYFEDGFSTGAPPTRTPAGEGVFSAASSGSIGGEAGADLLSLLNRWPAVVLPEPVAGGITDADQYHLLWLDAQLVPPPVLDPAGEGLLSAAAAGQVDILRRLDPTGEGLLSAAAAGLIQTSLPTVAPAGEGILSAAVAGNIVVSLVVTPAAEGLYSAAADGNIIKPTADVICRREHLIRKENRSVEV